VDTKKGIWLRFFRAIFLVYSPLLYPLVLLIACSTAATATPVVVPQEPTSPPTSQPQETAAPAPTSQPTVAVPLTERPQTARSKSLNVVALEPEHLFPLRSLDAHGGVMRDTFVATIGHLDGQTLDISSSPLIKNWKQTAPTEWVYELRPGVTFHDGAEWNSKAWKLYAQFAGVPDFGVNEFSHTGPYAVEPIDELNARIKCGVPCPTFARGLSQARPVSPRLLQEQDFMALRDCICTGPYKVDEWVPGQVVRSSIFEDFVPVPEVPEFAAPIIPEMEWVWREEPAVRTAMIEAGEADWAFLITLEDAERLGPERSVTGGTAEQAWFRMDTIWDPWLKQKKMRQAIVHSIDCQGIVDSLYDGQTTCRGNLGAPGVLGITENNLRPYEYNPNLSQQLLEEIGYICGLPNSKENCEAKITITSRSARIAFNTELVEAMLGFMRDVGINAEANVVDTNIWGPIYRCGIGSQGAQRAGYQGATEDKKPSVCDPGQIVDIIGSDYVTLDYGPFAARRLMCESVTSAVCVPEKNDEWMQTLSLSGKDRQKALEAVAAAVREQVYGIPMFDLFAVYGINPKLRGFENPRFDKRLFANLWWFEE
jgi:ABC-type transport system substrate-binding protein